MSNSKKNNVPKEPEVPLEPLSLEKEFDLRERRLKLVYKVLYVVATVWTVLFVGYAANIKDENPVYLGLLAIVTSLVVNILYFVFGEFRCLGITKQASTQIKDDAEVKFQNIWGMFGISVCISSLLAFLNLTIWSITATVGAIMVGVSIVPLLLLIFIDKQKVTDIIRSVFVPILCYTLYLLPSITEVSVHA